MPEKPHFEEPDSGQMPHLGLYDKENEQNGTGVGGPAVPSHAVA